MPCAVLTKALLTFVSKCESEPALDLWDQGCVKGMVESVTGHLGCSRCSRLESLARATDCRCARPGFCPDNSGAGLPAFPTPLIDVFPRLSCAPRCGPGGEETDRQPLVMEPYNKFLLSTYCMPGAVLNTGIQPKPIPALLKLNSSPWREVINRLN